MWLIGRITMIPIDSIEIPVDIQELCTNWAGDMGCMLRAVSSTGSLTLGTIRPRGCDTIEKWYLSIWMEFASDLAYNAHLARLGDDYGALACAEAWADDICDQLAESYGLEDWDACDED
jgi:hypothetical protein